MARKKTTAAAAPVAANVLTLRRERHGVRWVCRLDLAPATVEEGETLDALARRIWSAWRQVPEMCLRHGAPDLAILIEPARPVELEPGDPPTLIVEMKEPVYPGLEHVAEAMLMRVLTQMLGRAVAVRFDLAAEGAAS